jgi:hypothetical protein
MGMVIIHVKPRRSRSRKSRGQRRRERVFRAAARFMDLQESYGDCARG